MQAFTYSFTAIILLAFTLKAIQKSRAYKYISSTDTSFLFQRTLPFKSQVEIPFESIHEMRFMYLNSRIACYFIQNQAFKLELPNSISEMTMRKLAEECHIRIVEEDVVLK